MRTAAASWSRPSLAGMRPQANPETGKRHGGTVFGATGPPASRSGARRRIRKARVPSSTSDPAPRRRSGRSGRARRSAAAPGCSGSGAAGPCRTGSRPPRRPRGWTARSPDTRHGLEWRSIWSAPDSRPPPCRTPEGEPAITCPRTTPGARRPPGGPSPATTGVREGTGPIGLTSLRGASDGPRSRAVRPCPVGAVPADPDLSEP